jgi:hypothetical protein
MERNPGNQSKQFTLRQEKRSLNLKLATNWRILRNRIHLSRAIKTLSKVSNLKTSQNIAATMLRSPRSLRCNWKKPRISITLWIMPIHAFIHRANQNKAKLAKLILSLLSLKRSLLLSKVSLHLQDFCRSLVNRVVARTLITLFEFRMQSSSSNTIPLLPSYLSKPLRTFHSASKKKRIHLMMMKRNVFLMRSI